MQSPYSELIRNMPSFIVCVFNFFSGNCYLLNRRGTPLLFFSLFMLELCVIYPFTEHCTKLCDRDVFSRHERDKGKRDLDFYFVVLIVLFTKKPARYNITVCSDVLCTV